MQPLCRHIGFIDVCEMDVRQVSKKKEREREEERWMKGNQNGGEELKILRDFLERISDDFFPQNKKQRKGKWKKKNTVVLYYFLALEL